MHFLSARAGIGITAAGFTCPVPSASGSVAWRWQSQPVRLAVTDDGGETWRAQGAVLADGSSRPEQISEQALAGWRTRVFALIGDGAVLATSDAELTWTRQPVPRPAFQLAIRGETVWALACPTTPNRSTAPALTGLRFCRPVLVRTSVRGGRWTRVSLPPLRGVLAAKLTVVSNSTLVLGIERPGGDAGELLYTLDGGRRWHREPDPTWQGYPCSVVGAFAAAGPDTWWTVCLGAAAAGSSTKGLLRTKDNGRTWTTVSQVTSLLTPAPSSSTSISRGEPDALAAGSSTRLWLAYQNSMGESANGGATWTNVPAVDPQGLPASFDVLSSTHAWLVVPGEGLWRTTNGSHWAATTAIKPCASAQLRLTPGQRVSEPTQQNTRTFTLTNVAESTCSLHGYPAISLLDDHGVRLALRYRDGGDQVLTGHRPSTVTLAPLARAYAAINKNACVGHASETAARIRFTLPHGGGTLTMALGRRYPSLDSCPAGDPGHVLDISPFEPELSAVFAWHP